MPTAFAAMIGRPALKVRIAVLKPARPSVSRSPPNRFAAGTRQSLKVNDVDSYAFSPIFFSILKPPRPGVSLSTKKARWASRPFEGSRLACTRIQSEREAFPMKHFAPFRIQPSPSLRAAVLIAAASLPAPGSVMPKQAQRGRSSARKGPRNRCFCASVPIASTFCSGRPGPGFATITPRSQ